MSINRDRLKAIVANPLERRDEFQKLLETPSDCDPALLAKGVIAAAIDYTRERAYERLPAKVIRHVLGAPLPSLTRAYSADLRLANLIFLHEAVPLELPDRELEDGWSTAITTLRTMFHN